MYIKGNSFIFNIICESFLVEWFDDEHSYAEPYYLEPSASSNVSFI